METSVIGYDDKQTSFEELRQLGVVICQKLEEIDFPAISYVIVSPGISPKHPVYQKAIASKVSVLGEADFAFVHINQKVIGITGTNGKTTTTLLVEHILNHSGRKAKALGNVGVPFTDYILNKNPEEIIVAELSSYQLETLRGEIVDVAVVTNITPDHLDRYPSMVEYARAKANILHCCKKSAPVYVYGRILEEYKDLFPDVITYGSSNSDYSTTKEVAKEGEKILYYLPPSFRNLGIHESENILAAYLAVKNFGVQANEFLKALESFEKPPHRIEFVATIDGIDYYNDSKGTNLDAVLQAIKAMDKDIVLIAGGADKGYDFTGWRIPFLGKVKHVVTIGQTADMICRDLAGVCPIWKEGSLALAIERARDLVAEGECVLLSPGCSSVDMFRDYRHRGDEFKRCVTEIRHRRKENES